MDVVDESSSIFEGKALRREFVAGGIAGGIGIFIGFPMDLVKVNLQMYPEKYKTAWQCVSTTVKQSGFRSLYRGCLPPTFTQGFTNSLLFMGEATAMRFLQPNLKRGEVGTPINTVIAGSFGGVLQSIVLVPVDVIKCTMQATDSTSASAQQNVIKETMNCIKSIYRAEGIRGLYKGFAATLTRDMPSRGVYFFTYKNIREQLTKYQNLETPSAAATLFAGGMAGAMGWTSIYPFDVIKTHCQVTTIVETPTGQPVTAVKTLSMRNVIVNLYRKYGIRIFFKGLGVTVLRAFPVNAAIFYCYELTINWLHI